MSATICYRVDTAHEAIKALADGYTVRRENNKYLCWRDNPGVTARMRQTLDFIEEASAATGVSPSYEEIKVAIDVSSKSEIQRIITQLVNRGFLVRQPYCARSLKVVA